MPKSNLNRDRRGGDRAVLDAKLFVRAFSPQRISTALRTLDKSTGLIVGICWLAAFAMIVLTAFSVRGTVLAKNEATKVLVAEPILPDSKTVPIAAVELQKIVDRLKRQFPDIKIEQKQTVKIGQMIEVKCDDGARFHEWITALSYIDTMAPQFRWTLREFCVGACSNRQLMSAIVTGQKTLLSAPRQQQK